MIPSNDQLNLDKKEVQRILTNSGTHASVLLAVLFNLYGEDIFQADLLEIFLRIKEDIGVELPNSLEAKLGAVLTALTTPWYEQEPEVFISVNKSLTTGIFDPTAPDMFDISLEEILWGMYEIELLDGEKTFSPRIQKVIDKAIREHKTENLEENPVRIVVENAANIIEDLRALGFKKIPKLPKP